MTNKELAHKEAADDLMSRFGTTETWIGSARFHHFMNVYEKALERLNKDNPGNE